MNVSDFNRSRMVRDSFHTTTWGVIVAIVAVSIVVAAIFAYMNSKGNDTSGDDTRAVVNDEPISADINTTIPTAPAISPMPSPATPSPQP